MKIGKLFLLSRSRRVCNVYVGWLSPWTVIPASSLSHVAVGNIRSTVQRARVGVGWWVFTHAHVRVQYEFEIFSGSGLVGVRSEP